VMLPVPVCRLLFLLLLPWVFFGGFSGPFPVADDPGGRLSEKSAPHYARRHFFYTLFKVPNFFWFFEL